MQPENLQSCHQHPLSIQSWAGCRNSMFLQKLLQSFCPTWNKSTFTQLHSCTLPRVNWNCQNSGKPEQPEWKTYSAGQSCSHSLVNGTNLFQLLFLPHGVTICININASKHDDFDKLKNKHTFQTGMLNLKQLWMYRTMITESAFEVSMVHNWHKEAINGFTSKLEKHRTFHLKQSLQSRQIPCVTGNIHLHCYWTPKRSTHRQEFHFLTQLIMYLHRFFDHCQRIGCNLIELIGHSSPSQNSKLTFALLWHTWQIWHPAMQLH